MIPPMEAIGRRRLPAGPAGPTMVRDREERPMNEAEIVAALMRPDAYRAAVEAPVDVVRHRETHISHLFFAADRVFKLKKHIRLAFLDYGTLERRRHFCEEEVRLNRRLAPAVYLGAVPVCRAATGGLLVKGPGEPLAWAVAMVRLPEALMLENVLGEEGLSDERLEALVDVLVRFHARAATGEGIDEHGAPEAVARKVGGNLDEISRFVDEGLFPAELHRFLRDNARLFVAARRDLLLDRVREGRTREGHGDLHAGNICFAPPPLAPEGVAIYDCIEFNDALRCVDVAGDIAFLAMDLDRRGHAALSDRFVSRYAGKSGDPGLRAVLGLYKSHTAVVRAKVAALAAATEVPGEASPDERRSEARGYLQLAAACALPPALVLTCGLPASGKSWLARRLAGPLGAVVLSSDVVRKRLAGLDPSRPSPAAFRAGIYDEEMTDRTYGRLLESAVALVRGGRTVIVDATFPDRARRAPFAAAAAEEGCPLQVLHVTAPEQVVRGRLDRRERGEPGPSDAGHDVHRRARAAFEPPGELVPHVLEVTSGADDPDAVGESLLVRRLAHRGPG